MPMKNPIGFIVVVLGLTMFLSYQPPYKGSAQLTPSTAKTVLISPYSVEEELRNDASLVNMVRESALLTDTILTNDSLIKSQRSLIRLQKEELQDVKPNFYEIDFTQDYTSKDTTVTLYR